MTKKPRPKKKPTCSLAHREHQGHQVGGGIALISLFCCQLLCRISQPGPTFVYKRGATLDKSQSTSAALHSNNHAVPGKCSFAFDKPIFRTLITFHFALVENSLKRIFHLGMQLIYNSLQEKNNFLNQQF